MKHKLKQALTTAALLLCSMVAMAETATVDGIIYEFITKAKLAMVVAIESGSYSGNIVIPEIVGYDGVAYSVTKIGVAAFSGCTGLTSITIPNSVTEIYEFAFKNCTRLTSVTIGNGVTTIGDDAFEACISLTAVHISDLSAWCNIDFVNRVFAYYSRYHNPLYYAHNLYLNGELVTHLVIPDDVTEIKDYTFSYCSCIFITIPNSVTTIGNSAFSNCDGLASVTIPNSVTTIESNAFHSCSRLTAVRISDLSAWCNIDFGDLYANPLYYAHNLIINGYLETDLVIPGDITEIKDYAFYGCTGLTSVTIGNSVTTIGDDAFNGCTGLTSVTIPNSVTTIGQSAFWGCNSLTSVTIPNSVTTIESGAFDWCAGLTSVVIGSNVETIRDYAFAGCGNLTDVYCYATSVPTTNSNAFEDSYIEYATLHVPEESIDSYKSTEPWSSFGTKKAIENEIELTYEFDATEKTATVVASKGDSYTGNITIPETVEHNGAMYSVTTIGDYAFYGCSGLTNVVIGNNVTTIGYMAFYSCDGLTSITIPSSVTTIGDNAFYGCTGLTSITIPNSVTTIGYMAFSDCTGLTSIVVESGNTKYDSREGCNAIIETATNTLVAGCKNTVIPKSVTTIGIRAFYNCTGLTSVTIPNSVTTIGYMAFSDCTGLTSITIPNSVTTIGNSAFSDCSGLTSITIPNSVTTIEIGAFYNCI